MEVLGSSHSRYTQPCQGPIADSTWERLVRYDQLAHARIRHTQLHFDASLNQSRAAPAHYPQPLLVRTGAKGHGRVLANRQGPESLSVCVCEDYWHWLPVTQDKLSLRNLFRTFQEFSDGIKDKEVQQRTTNWIADVSEPNPFVAMTCPCVTCCTFIFLICYMESERLFSILAWASHSLTLRFTPLDVQQPVSWAAQLGCESCQQPSQAIILYSYFEGIDILQLTKDI